MEYKKNAKNSHEGFFFLWREEIFQRKKFGHEIQMLTYYIFSLKLNNYPTSKKMTSPSTIGR